MYHCIMLIVLNQGEANNIDEFAGEHYESL